MDAGAVLWSWRSSSWARPHRAARSGANPIHGALFLVVNLAQRSPRLYLTLRRRVPRRRPGHRLRRRHRGAVRVRDHGPDSRQGGDGPGPAAAVSGCWRCPWWRRFLLLAGVVARGRPVRARRPGARPAYRGRRGAGAASVHRTTCFPFELTSVLLLAAHGGRASLLATGARSSHERWCRSPTTWRSRPCSSPWACSACSSGATRS